MRKRGLGGMVVVLGLLAPQLLAAQVRLSLGPMAGLNFADFRTKDFADNAIINSRTGFLAGAFANIGLGPNFAIEPEVLFAQKGATFPADVNVQGKFKLDYLQIPVLAQIRFPAAGVTPYLLVGPSFGFRVSCEVAAESGSVSINLGCDDPDLDLQLKKSEVSGVVGVGADVAGVTLSARFDYGLSRINQDVTAGGKVYNRVFTFTVGYGFRLIPR